MQHEVRKTYRDDTPDWRTLCASATGRRRTPAVPFAARASGWRSDCARLEDAMHRAAGVARRPRRRRFPEGFQAHGGFL
jgi:hypothetical protein